MVPEDVPLPVLRGQPESAVSNDGRFSFWDGSGSRPLDKRAYGQMSPPAKAAYARFDLRG